VVKNEKNKLIPQRTMTKWRMCIDYQKLHKATKKDHFPLPFIEDHVWFEDRWMVASLCDE
jgi:hypothetical protein